MIFAQIVDGKVNLIKVKSDEVLQTLRNNGMTIIDITDVEPQPRKGWTYENGAFIAPAAGGGGYITKKSVYTNSEFVAMIPPVKLTELRSSTNDIIGQWVYMVPMLPVIDLNDLPVWFTDGLDAIVTEGIFTQNQVNAFLEI